jgi:hypothetical protein
MQNVQSEMPNAEPICIEHLGRRGDSFCIERFLSCSVSSVTSVVKKSIILATGA